MTEGFQSRMHIQVNGEPRQVREAINVTDLLRDLQLNVERVAVEVNLEILDRRAFDAKTLQEGDRIEILSFIGGGALPVVASAASNAAFTPPL